MSPIDIIADAIRAAVADPTIGPHHVAEVAARALTDERVVANAVARLEAEGRTVTPGLVATVRTVLGSIGGA